MIGCFSLLQNAPSTVLENAFGGKTLDQPGSGIEIFHKPGVLSEHDVFETGAVYNGDGFQDKTCQVIGWNRRNDLSGLQLNHAPACPDLLLPCWY